MADPIEGLEDSPTQDIEKAYGDYYDFDKYTKAVDTANANRKLEAWKNMKGDPEYLLMVFFTCVMMGGDFSSLGGDGSSLTHEQENQLTEVGKELNYASAYRDTVTDIKNVLTAHTTDTAYSLARIRLDIRKMKEYMDPSMFDPEHGVPEIFQGGEDTFDSAFADISSICDKIGPELGKPYSSFDDFFNKAQKQGDTQAGQDWQKFTNATDSLFSSVGVQQNVLQTQLQDIESNYKSYLSSDSEMLKSLFSIITNAINQQIPK